MIAIAAIPVAAAAVEPGPLGGLDLLGTVLPLAVAAACGGLIGWDREAEGRAAGLRTHVMVCLGSAGFAVTALRMVEVADVDPARIVGAIVGGVGFLGAGSIIKSDGRVRGLTTAAGLWVVAGIGIASGLGLYDIAAITTVLAIATLTVMRRIEPSPRSVPAKADPVEADPAEAATAAK